jgi:hypothetical protein
MKTIDNHGNLVSEINHCRTLDGRFITTNTTYNTNTGRTIFQNIIVRESNGKVSNTNVFGGKLLP